MKKKKLILIIIIAFFAIGIVSGVIHNITGTTPAEKPDVKTTNSKIVVDDFLECPAFTADKNTSEMVDQIATTAKDNSKDLTDDQAAQIIDAIKTADHGFYNGPEEMEKFMWYGYLLDSKYDDSDPRSSLGTDLCQAIKYVYRNEENVTDNSTHENLLQIDKDLEQIQ